MLPRLPSIVAALSVLLATVTSGSLECSHTELTEAERHGGELYGRICAVCHGAAGEGYKADQAPAIAHPDFLATVSDEYLRAAITYGRSNTTMSAWARERGGPLSKSDVDAVIAFMRRWQTRPRAPLDDGPNSGNAAHGEAIFARECARCHGAKGVGGTYEAIGNPQLLSTASNGFLRHAILGGRPGTAMPPFGQTLSNADTEDVLAALRLWQSPPIAPAAHREPPPPPTPPLPLGPVPLNPHGPEPVGFRAWPQTSPADVIEKQLERHARMAILDARAPSDYVHEHITGAVSVPFYDPDPYFAKLPKDAWLVCYCACPHAESGQLAQRLASKGFKKVTVLDEGLGVWRARNYGTHTGTDP